MKPSEQAIKEFAETWARLLKSKHPNVKEMFIAHHNVFVSEHYYPKEKYDELLLLILFFKGGIYESFNCM